MRTSSTLPMVLLTLGCLGACANPVAQHPGAGDETHDEVDDESVEELPLPLLAVASTRVLPGVSGLVRHDGSLYLAVHDTKRDESGPRFAALLLDDGAPPVYRELEVAWGDAAVSHDLEAIAAIPGRPGEYLATESERRLMHLAVSGAGLGELEVQVVGLFELPDDADNLEGIAVAARGENELLLGLCERNEKKGDPDREPKTKRYAFIRWSALRLDDYSMTPLASWRLRATRWPKGKGLRTCSDLYLDRESGTLWLSATVEPDKKPQYDSIVYRFDFDPAAIEADEPRELEPWARIADLKLEAIAAPLLPGWGPTFGSDGDEARGRVWPTAPTSWMMETERDGSVKIP